MSTPLNAVVATPHTQVTRDILALLNGWQPDTSSEELARTLILTHVEQWGGASIERGCPGGHVCTSGVLVHTPTGVSPEALLTLHPKFGRWMQLGGHIEPTDHGLEAAALREVREESGQEHDRVTTFLGAAAIPDVLCDGRRTHHFDLRFLILTDTQVAATSEESDDLAWWPLSQLPAGTDADLALLARQTLTYLHPWPSSAP